MSEATAVEVAVRFCVVLAIVYLRELQASIQMQILAVEVLVGAQDLHGDKSNIANETEGSLAVRVL